MCVNPFPLSNTRQGLMKNLEEVIQTLRDARVVGEIWVDGSFMTQKVDPEDIDILLRIDADTYDNGTPRQQTQIDKVAGGLRDSHNCDSYVHLEWPPGDPQHAGGQRRRKEWMKQFGTGHTDQPKGMAEIVL